MRLYLYGHEYKYAVEQMLFTMFPGEKPEYPEGKAEGDRIEVKLSRAAKYTTATCKLVRDGECFSGKAAETNADADDNLELDRVCQRIIKKAMYKAVLASGMKKPVWGALTGVRPGKLFCALLNKCGNEQEALKQFIDEYDVSPERAALCMDTSRETLKAIASLDKNDVCLYVGIPFCPTRCTYCSFVSQSVEKSMKLIPPFVEALFEEVKATAQQVRELGLRVVAIYFGGGTPTTLSASQLDEVCALMQKEFDLSQLREYTVEAGRPDTITEDKLKVLRRYGVDRVSVNPQTMSDNVLDVIGRRHSAQDIVDALAKVRDCGGFSVNMDLIAGLPADSVEGFEDTINKVIELAPENITIHTLSMKKGSTISAKGAQLPGAAEVAVMLDTAEEKLRVAGYSPYYLYRQKNMSGGFENVGWTKAGYVNLYNICIMEELCSIIAMGGGGSTKLVRADEGRNIRMIAPKYPLEYINNIEKTCKDKKKIKQFYLESEE